MIHPEYIKKAVRNYRHIIYKLSKDYQKEPSEIVDIMDITLIDRICNENKQCPFEMIDGFLQCNDEFRDLILTVFDSRIRDFIEQKFYNEFELFVEGKEQNNIVGIMDMDGFLIRKKFHCKELGTIAVKDEQPISYFFRDVIDTKKLTAKENGAIQYVQNHIHGIPIGGDGLPENSLKDIVLEFYRKNRVNGKSAIAYKGGTIEKELLTKLGIPHTNLEDYGCPKASELFRQKKNISRKLWEAYINRKQARTLPKM